MSDDEIIDPEDLDPAMLIEVDPDAEVLDADSIDLEGDEDAFGADDNVDDSAAVDESEDPDAIPVATDSVAKKAGDDDDDDEDGVVVDDKTDGMERLQPRRPDETQCTQCFLLVRNSAPGCPVEDDACPLFK